MTTLKSLYNINTGQLVFIFIQYVTAISIAQHDACRTMIKPGKYSALKIFSSNVINLFAKENEDQEDEEEQEQEQEEQEQDEEEEEDYFEEVRCTA